MHVHCSDKRTHARLAVLQWPQDTSRGEKSCYRGFTLIELMIVVAMIATLTAMALPIYANALNKAKITKAIADIRTFEKDIELYRLYNGELPDTLADIGRANFLDPYSHPYKYLNFKNAKKSNKWGGTKGGTEKPRKDKFLKPLNAEYDLYSKGKDGETKEDLNAKESWDDIVRAVDGGFLGLASEF